MDFWSRLIAGTSLSPAGNKASSNNPEQRHARFKREYNQLLQVWRTSSNLSQDNDAADSVRSIIQELTSILSDESRRPSPHKCISFAASKQMYLPIGKIATTSYNEPIIREAVAFFSTLIESEEEDFVENDAFSQSLMNLLNRITGANSIRLGSETEVEVVELAFGIAAKIRLQPEVLSAWFRTHEEREHEHVDKQAQFVGKTHKEDFPLFYLLIDYMHHDGRVGDFARTGMLYIIESASTSAALEQWIVESDLATLMSTGLGALYSGLSRKLVIDYLPEDLPAILALSDYRHPVATSDIVSSTSVDFQGHMETFLSHLVFWQDVLEHCKSVEVKSTLLEHFQVLFLKQLLYPSLLESSDIDGGSSVAVLTYLRRILEALDHPDMIHMILQYLLALPEPSTPTRTSRSHANVSAARKRKSMDLQTMMAMQTGSASTPALYNLVDLILGSLQSQSQQTISVTLQLLSVILRRHHRYATKTLLKTGPSLRDTPRTIGMHEKELEFLMGLVDDVGTDEHLEESYESHVKDSMTLLESHSCSQDLIAPKAADGTPRFQGPLCSIPGAPRDTESHTLRPDDPILRTLLKLLNGFYTNAVEINLGLTESIIDLAACGFMDVSGWLLPDPSRYTYEDEMDDDNPMTVSTLLPGPKSDDAAQLAATRRAHRRPEFPPSRTPALLTTLQRLVHQAELYRTQVPRFDDLLSQRRLALSSDPLPKPVPIRHQPPRARGSISSTSSTRSMSPPAQKPSAFDAFAQRIFPDLSTPNSRSGSPRGRRSMDRTSTGTGSGAATPTPSTRNISSQGPSGLQLLGSPAGSVMGTPSRSRGNSRAFSPSPLRAAEAGGGVEESQARAFREIDRGILARRVGVPKATPVPFSGGDKMAGGDRTEGQDIEDLDLGSKADESADEQVEEKTVSVNHVLTNVIVLQEFLLELAALVQVRAGLFGEVSFA